MQLRHLKTVRGASDLSEGRFERVTGLAFSPNNLRLAVATADRYVTLYDENGEQKDRFATKAGAESAVGGGRNYSIRAIEFSPDSSKLAVAQSDNIVFVYKLGLKWFVREHRLCGTLKWLHT